ncbi:prealbumin-like fold domain-containing protein [Bifidobacterium imperatoris]|uniref:Cell surface protein n=1 Tax=Bifidobacterium imperatoris TaxID=2020965 RepID=A0A2N5IU70_9BIFI|nr:prealbumin-like fold domain-containing protein [Bifidobacterium imperatoris]PLS25525.1 cell surface protein [Bifidobacterium imperatoris]QSY57096.1 prealbumin-like fold domain-containing protein [Bifidobacterium imperatoris]
MASMHNSRGIAARHMLGAIISLAVVLSLIVTGITAAIITPQAQAANVGSLTIDAVWDRGEMDATPLAGDTYAIVRVASVDLDDVGNIADFHMLEPFTQFEQNWESITSSQYHDAAVKIAGYVNQHNLYAQSAVTNVNGKAWFTGLPLGLYLVERTGTADANTQYDCDPFLVAIPGNDSGTALLDVTAEPKFSEQGTVTPPTDELTPKPEAPANTGSAVKDIAIAATALAVIALLIGCCRRRDAEN